MPVKLLQPSFGGGEYAPELVGRQDLARYGISARTMLNWIPRATGGMQTRMGTKFCAATKDSSKASRLVPFVVSETLAYVVELGHLYARFYYRGALLMDGASPVEVATPWSSTELRSESNEVWALRFTQSADTLFAAHGRHAPRLLKRTGAAAFALTQFTPREGPFRSLNGNSALLMAASGSTGAITLTSNFDVFDGMLGALVYLEPLSLGTILPWVQGERTPGLFNGALRRSDSKIYRATNVSVPTGGTTGLNFCETGNVRPEHETGREWDGPGTSKNFDGTVYNTGVEWEYVHSGYGIAEITSVATPRLANATVRKTMPPEVVGGMGTPGATWTFSGDGTSSRYMIVGAQSDSPYNYTVSIGGAPVQADPNYHPPGGNGGTGGSGGGMLDPEFPQYAP